MSDIDWTTVIGYLIGSGGTITLVALAWIQMKKPKHAKEDENRAVAETHAPVSPGNSAYTVNGLISLANEVGTLSKEVSRQKDELEDVRRELGLFRRSYTALYWWSQKIITDWDDLRENADPPALPTDIHHP